MADRDDVTSATDLLRGIAETARAHGNTWDVARLAEMLELYGLYLRGAGGRRTWRRRRPRTLGFGDFVANETLIERLRATRNAARRS